jgi:hypothetical protein
MHHLSEEQLIELYYGPDGSDGREGPEAARHLDECAACARAYEALRADLTDMRPVAVPRRDDAYGRQVWEAIADRLPAAASRPNMWFRQPLWVGLMASAACALLVVAAFFAGRQWEHRHQPQTVVATHPAPAAPEKRVLVVVLGDHLDRSERLLVQLKHASAGDTELASPMRDEAKALLAANRTCRQEAEASGDPALTQALDHLDQLLTELANHPGTLDADDISRLQQQMNKDGLLFEVRVLRARIPDRHAANHKPFKGGIA